MSNGRWRRNGDHYNTRLRIWDVQQAAWLKGVYLNLDGLDDTEELSLLKWSSDDKYLYATCFDEINIYEVVGSACLRAVVASLNRQS